MTKRPGFNRLVSGVFGLPRMVHTAEIGGVVLPVRTRLGSSFFVSDSRNWKGRVTRRYARNRGNSGEFFSFGHQFNYTARGTPYSLSKGGGGGLYILYENAEERRAAMDCSVYSTKSSFR